MFIALKDYWKILIMINIYAWIKFSKQLVQIFHWKVNILEQSANFQKNCKKIMCRN